MIWQTKMQIRKEKPPQAVSAILLICFVVHLLLGLLPKPKQMIVQTNWQTDNKWLARWCTAAASMSDSAVLR